MKLKPCPVQDGMTNEYTDKNAGGGEQEADMRSRKHFYLITYITKFLMFASTVDSWRVVIFGGML